MSFFSEVLVELPFPPYTELHAAYGFVPNLFRAQSALPGALAAQLLLLRNIVFIESGLSRLQKESMLLAAAAACGNSYCIALQAQTLRRLGMADERIQGLVNAPDEDLAASDARLRAFSAKLASCAAWISGRDVEDLRRVGIGDDRILEAVVTAALGQFLCTLADGLHPSMDTQLGPPVESPRRKQSNNREIVETSGPYLRSVSHTAREFPPFAFLQEQLGFVPNLFRAQTLRPDILEAEVHALASVLLCHDVLNRVQKERILLVVSAANSNTYCVTVHSQILSLLGVSLEDSDQIVSDHHRASISDQEKTLLDCAIKLSVQPSEFGLQDVDRMQSKGFSKPQILEAIVMVSLSNFFNTVQMGLGAVPDFAPRGVFAPNILYLSPGDARPKTYVAGLNLILDADAELVAGTQSGDTRAFEELVRRHTRRIFGMLGGMLGNADDARDAVQDSFMKAFEHIGSFQGRSKFSTWLTSIAINCGTERLRTRKGTESLDDDPDDETFRPRQLYSWTDNPEQLASTAQMRDLVREAVQRLPEKYRSAILLRDIGQLSTEDAASVLGLAVPALKARLLRGRLMLREALAPHFAQPQARSTRAEL